MKTMIKQHLFLIIILSALLYSFAFILSLLSWCVIPAVFLLFIIFKNLPQCSFKKTILYGIVWGFLVASIHTSWLIIMLISKINTPLIWAILLYGTFVSYLTILFLLFFLVIKYFQMPLPEWFRLIIILFIFKIFFSFLSKYGLFIFGFNAGGYPFFSPMIPLMHYVKKPAIVNNIGHIPIVYDTAGKRVVFNQEQATQKMFHALCKFNNKNKGCIITGESAYPWALNLNNKAIKLFSAALTSKQTFLLGSIYKDQQGLEFQAVYLLTDKGIKKIICKKHAVPFFERMPTFLKKCTMIRAVLNAPVDFNTNENATIDTIFVQSIGSARIAICSDFFLGRLRFNIGKASTTTLLIVNDGWYVSYFRKIMENFTLLEALCNEVSIVYIGHFYNKTMVPKGLLCKSLCLKMLKALAWLVR